MSRRAWLFLGAFLAGIGCVVAGVLLTPQQAPGAPRPDLPPLVLGLLIAGAVLVIVGGRFGLAPLLQWGVASGKVPNWLLLVILLVLVGAAVAYLLLHG
jgi:hypothetical protein